MSPVLSASKRPTGYSRRALGTKETTVGFPPGSRAVDITPRGLLSAYTSRGSGATGEPSTATPLDSSTSRAGSAPTSPPTLTRPFAISFSAARRDATPEWARYFASRTPDTLPHLPGGPEAPRRHARRRWRAALPPRPDLGVDRPGRGVLRGHDERPRRTARAPASRRPALVARAP